MENPKDVKDIKDKVIGYIEGYKNVQFIEYCFRTGDYSRLAEVYSEDEIHFILMSPYYTKYQIADYYLYTRIENAIEQGPLLNYPHDIDIEAYVKGMYERNNLVWLGQDVKSIFYFVNGKKVLDFGCGGCFYTIMFDALGATVLSYDRKDVANVMKIWKPELSIYTRSLKELLPSVKEFDVVWVSEVLHGQEEESRKLLLRSLVLNMKPKSILIINELRPKTVLSQMFEYQMRIHCKGKLLDRKDIIEMTEMLSIQWYNTTITDYHCIYQFRKEE